MCHSRAGALAGLYSTAARFVALLQPLIIVYTIIVAISFDPRKRRITLARHGIDLAECEVVFDHDVLTWEDAAAEGEVRMISIGLMRGRAVVLVWTDREPVIHLISCREAEPHEAEEYFQAFFP